MAPTDSEVAEDRRSAIESTYNVERDGIEKQYVIDKTNLENTYHSDIEANRVAKEEAFITEGLNSDGSDPQGRPQG